MRMGDAHSSFPSPLIVPRFLACLPAVPSERYEVDPELAKALEIIFIVHLDHEQNASTSTVRTAGEQMGQKAGQGVPQGTRQVEAACLLVPCPALSRLNQTALTVCHLPSLGNFLPAPAGSSQANPFACVASGIAALWGPAHGGANEAVLKVR